MAKRGAERNYKVGPKNNWRRTIWNEVLSRTNGREQAELILYLAGPNDIDREIAIDKGVPPENLIAIDRDRSNAHRVRGNGSSALHGDALDILWSWPDNKRVCAVLLDFCSGIECCNAAIYDAFQKKSLRSAVIMVNFMRGRDKWSNEMRNLLSSAGLLMPLWKVNTDTGETIQLTEATSRASQFILFHAWQTWSVGRIAAADLISGRIPEDQNSSALSWPHDDASEDERRDFVMRISTLIGAMEPKFFSYKSGPITFDSVVFEHLSRCLDDLSESNPFFSLKSKAEASIRRRTNEFKELGVVRRIAAMMAIRTMRKARL